MYPKVVNQFLYDQADDKENFAASAKTRLQRVVCAARKQLMQEAGVVTWARGPKNISVFSTPSDSLRLGKRASTQYNQASFGLALKGPSQNEDSLAFLRMEARSRLLF